ncbi:uncharacterized protein LOC111247817 isoform X2 [Varroa destructor]|uniref:Receptor-type tyrosine-protein phosphatase N2 n=1 Tax=Varroa destructor TaxID=109461 RepID=A0A7M7JNX3_VARDE|nr:uncharacterized protein LOC111247817 isoform X2 [Varroa destructor]
MCNVITKARKKWALFTLVVTSAAVLETGRAVNAYDGVFGVCRGPGDPPERSSLSSGTTSIRLLESELARLWSEGYRWPDEYTQCVVRQLLEGARQGAAAALYDPGYCAHALKLALPAINGDVTLQLSNVDPADQAFIRFTPNLLIDDGSSGRPRLRPNYEIAGTFADEVFTPPLVSATPSAEGHDPERELRRLEALTSVGLSTGGNGISSSISDNNGAIGNDFLPPEATRKGQDKDDDGSKSGNKRTRAANVDEITDSKDDLEEQEDNRFARDVQENLWRGRSSLTDGIYKHQQLRSDQIIDDVEDEEGIVGNLPHPIEKRSRPIGEWIWSDDDRHADTKDPKTDNLELLLNLMQQYDQDQTEISEDDEQNLKAEAIFRRRNKENDYSSLEDPESIALSSAGESDQDEQNNVPSDQETPLDMLMSRAPDNSDLVGELRVRGDPFIRPMRLDTKKPGPGYYYHEPEEGQNEREYQKEMRRLQQKMLSEKSIDGDDLIEALNEINQNGQKREIEIVGVPPSRVPERHAAGVAPLDPYHTDRGVEAIDANTAYLVVKNINTGSTVKDNDAIRLALALEKIFGLPTGTISQVRLNGSQVDFKLLPNEKGLNASEMIRLVGDKNGEILRATNLSISSGGIGERVKYEVISPRSNDLFLFTFVVCGSVVGVLLAISVIYIVRRHQLSRDKLHGLNGEDDPLAKFDYQDLCRQRMVDSGSGKEGALAAAMEAGRAPDKGSPKKVKIASQQSHDSSRSSTSSWSEEPVAPNMDISTGHMILSYMEDHLKSKNRLDEEWEGLCAYETDPSSTSIAEKSENAKKNRYMHALPYDHARVILSESSNAEDSDYINASAITDHDPRNPAYIATQGPLPHTASDFWQMVWEQGSVVIVTLTRLMENGVAMCHRYWPEEGSEVYSLYEVHLVSEHVWCDDYLVRSFYLKNLNTSETRTVTQFHFLSWPEAGVPPSAKALLDFRRKVNKSYRGRSCPIVVHCSDGSGRTGTYILADMVLNRIAKGAKEIDVAATLEHVRDQRANMVRTKAQFEFVLTAIAEEVHAILKALSKE